MTLNEYQASAKETAIYSQKFKITYPAFGLISEAGEVAGKMKKLIRDKDAKMDEHDKLQIIKELGDVLWYIAILADDLGTPLDDVAMMNVQKLSARKESGTLQGSGDNR